MPELFFPLSPMPDTSTDIAILAGGMVDMALAHQLTERFPDLSITLIDKAPELGMHSSGRNIGVLHAGIYYPPNTFKAMVCVGCSQTEGLVRSRGSTSTGLRQGDFFRRHQNLMGNLSCCLSVAGPAALR